MEKKILTLTEEQLRVVIKETLIDYLYSPDNEIRKIEIRKLVEENGGIHSGEEYIYENIDEGLITSYDMKTSKAYLKKQFPNIVNVRSLRYNPYKPNTTTRKNDFVAIDLKNYSNFKDIIATVKNLLGWFATSILVREAAKGGYIERKFDCFGDNEIQCPDLNDDRYLEKNGFKIYLSEHRVLLFSIICEAKYGKLFTPKPTDVFYHATDMAYLDRILKQGLVPRAKGNFPERIYLGTSIPEIRHMVENNLADMVILEINASGLKLYQDEREATACYTYDNISPDRITNIFQFS